MTEAKDDYPRFDAQGVIQRREELNRQHWIRAGRQEVVEWMDTQRNYDGDGWFELQIDVRDYKAKLKEWGIE